MISRFHAQAISEMAGGELHAICGRNPTSTQALAREFGVAAYQELEAFLSDPELEVVTIGTPSGAHLEPARAALEAGKHVVVEKPLEITTERIDQLMAVAADSPGTLSAILNRRFHPGMEAFKQAAEQERFGRLVSASAYIKWYREQAYYDSAAWRGTWSLDGGGALMNQSIHTVDALLHLAGSVKRLTASAVCLAHERIEVEDHCVALLEFSNGARGVIEASTATWSAEGHPARVQLAGTEGSVFLADESFELWDFREARPEDEEIHRTLLRGREAGLGAKDPKAIATRQHRENFEEVVRAIREGREPATSAAEARKSVALIEAIYASAQAGGEWVSLEEQA